MEFGMIFKALDLAMAVAGSLADAKERYAEVKQATDAGEPALEALLARLQAENDELGVG